MIDAIAAPAELALPLSPEEDADDGLISLRWLALAEDLRFFITCYLAGLVVFLVMLS